MEGVWGQDDHREGHCLSYLLCVSSLLVLGLEEAPMSQGQGPWSPQHLFVLLGHTPRGRASSLGSTINQTPATVPLVPQWPLVAPLFSSPFPWFSKITHLRIPQPNRAWCISGIRMDSIPRSGKVPQGWIFYPQMLATLGHGMFHQRHINPTCKKSEMIV